MSNTPIGESRSIKQAAAQPVRDEQGVFNELADLCAAPGYIHALAYLYQSNNWITYRDEVTAKDMLPNYSREKLIRTELSTLFGLLVRHEIDFSYPGADAVQSYIDRSNALLLELHHSLERPMREEMLAMAQGQPPPMPNPASMGAFLREAIFYGAESAYAFQYLDLARLKYRADEAWLVGAKGFSIDAACDVVKSVFDIQPDRILSNAQDIRNKRELWSALPAFSFSVAEIAELSKLPANTVEAVLAAFAMDMREKNATFTSLKEFNEINATPLLQGPGGSFFFFHPVSITEALYESPFYWMLTDKAYSETALRHRGEFTEEYSLKRLVKVFGDARVHPNIELIDSHGNRSGEVDILCVLADHYPSLSFQARQFLKLDTNSKILPPFVTDVFAIDVITEMLESPLRLLSYLNRRVTYNDRVMASHETNVLAYHLRKNLWMNSNLSFMMVDDDVAIDLDIAMAARRTGIPGARTPKGILTRLESTVIAQILSEIEDKEEPAVIEFGFMVLTLGEDTIMEADHQIQRLNTWTCRDGKLHDFTMSMSAISSGITFHCNGASFEAAQRDLYSHCARRKYVERAGSWFGVCLQPGDLKIRTGVTLQHEWEQDATLDESTKGMAAARIGSSTPKSRLRTRSKTGRNDPCPCGSGVKYKKCCLGRP